MNVLVLAALTEATGNAVTARRVASHLETTHNVTLVDSVGTSLDSLRQIVLEKQIQVALGVHALLAGPFLRTLQLPFALVLGGTDLYEPMHELQQRQMAGAVGSASCLIAFSPENRTRAEWMWPHARDRVKILPQAVDVPKQREAFAVRAQLGLKPRDRLVLLPTGIRRVKDPLHVVEAFSAWHRANPEVHLAIAGAVLEPGYAESALEVMRSRPGVHYVGALPRPAMLAAIHQADVVLNTSLSEGMCGVVLEAMALGTVVVARRNAGNESLVFHGHTGLLYDTPAELVHWLQAILGSPELAERLSETAARRILERHGLELERQAYLQVLEQTLTPLGPVVAIAPSRDELEVALAAGRQLGLAKAVQDEVAAARSWALEDATRTAEVRALAALLATAPPSVAIAKLRAWMAAHGLALETPSSLALLLSLTQVPLAEARLQTRGLEDKLILDTLSDLTDWAHHFQQTTGKVGLTVEILEWAQKYLRGELLRVGPMQFDLRPFAAPWRVYRHLETGKLSAVGLDDRPLDLTTGVPLAAGPLQHPLSDWALALEPGSPVLEIWIQGAFTPVRLQDAIGAMLRALRVFRRLSPETAPVAMCGETWRLDPQVAGLVDDETGIRELQRVSHLYPSAITEAATLRRLFGPHVERRNLASVRGTSPLQTALLAFLDDPAHCLQARGGFILREELERLPEYRETA